MPAPPNSPTRERIFFEIFATMIGALALARLMPGAVRRQIVDTAKAFLLDHYDNGAHQGG